MSEHFNIGLDNKPEQFTNIPLNEPHYNVSKDQIPVA